MQKVGIKPTDRPTVPAARQAMEQAKIRRKGNRGVFCGAAIELPDGQIITGMNTALLHAESAVVLNALKTMAGIPAPIDLLPEGIIANILALKHDILHGRTPSLNVEEVLIALSISAASNPTCTHCLQKLKDLKGCEMHSTHTIGKGDENGLRKLRVNLTTDATPTSRGFYY